MDRSKADNPLKGDKYWTDADILVAMELAAAAANDLPPYVGCVFDGSNLPAVEWAYHAIQEKLYESTIARMERNAFVYRAGNTTYDEDQEQISLLNKALVRLVQWRSSLLSQKRTMNSRNFYGEI